MALECSREQLEVGARLNDGGGQGIVYDVGNVLINKTLEVVYKEYHQAEAETVNWRVLRRLTDIREDLPAERRRVLLGSTAWPIAIVTGKSNRPVGVLMRKAPAEFWFMRKTPSGETKNTLAQVMHLLNRPEVVRGKGIDITDHGRYLLLYDIATTLVLLHHDLDIAAGDISAGNLLFSLSGTPRAFFIDCDSMSLGGRQALVQKETVNWKVQDAYPNEQLATPASDSYKLGLFALRLFAGQQNAFRRDDLPATVHQAVRELIEASSKAADQRPDAKQWEARLAEVANRGAGRGTGRVGAEHRNVSTPTRSAVTPAMGGIRNTRRAVPDVAQRIHRRQRQLVAVLSFVIVVAVVLNVMWALFFAPDADAASLVVVSRSDTPAESAAVRIDEPATEVDGDLQRLSSRDSVIAPIVWFGQSEECDRLGIAEPVVADDTDGWTHACS